MTNLLTVLPSNTLKPLFALGVLRIHTQQFTEFHCADNYATNMPAEVILWDYWVFSGNVRSVNRLAERNFVSLEACPDLLDEGVFKCGNKQGCLILIVRVRQGGLKVGLRKV